MLDDATLRATPPDLLEDLRSEPVGLTGERGLLTALVREVLQAALELEMAEHLGHRSRRAFDPGSGNSRNGSYLKTLTTEVGPVVLAIPRDRAGTFEPVTVPKYLRRDHGLAANVFSVCVSGVTGAELETRLAGLYRPEVRAVASSTIARLMLENRLAWLSRPLPDPALMIFDALAVGSGDPGDRRVFGVAVGVTAEGARALLALWLGGAGMTDHGEAGRLMALLNSRGIRAPRVVCVDEPDLHEAVQRTWPDACVRAGIADLVTNSLRPQDLSPRA